MAMYKVFYYIDTLKRNRDMLADLAGQAGIGTGGMGNRVERRCRARPATASRPRATAKKGRAEAASAEEISTLKQGLDEALSVLKKAKLGGKTGRGQYLYQLPWYIIIGPPGSGKTTALINSGLRFPLGAGKVRGVGGTRNCDWWFTDEAVLAGHRWPLHHPGQP
jgi:type VI secretion system protein ImpL